MKIKKIFLAALAVTMLLLVSCEPSAEPSEIDPNKINSIENVEVKIEGPITTESQEICLQIINNGEQSIERDGDDYILESFEDGEWVSFKRARVVRLYIATVESHSTRKEKIKSSFHFTSGHFRILLPVMSGEAYLSAEFTVQ